jgi:ABC-type glycerol-3-phosphate transport system substrate-binding protein
MRRLFIPWLIIFAISACGLPGQAAVTPSVPTDVGGAGRVQISFGVWEYELAVYQPLAEQFNEEHPDIEVIVVPIDEVFESQGDGSGETTTSALRRLVAMVDTSSTIAVAPDAYGSALLLDLRPLIEADTSLDDGEFLEGALDRVTVDGGVWSLPRYFYVNLLSYNRALLNTGDTTVRAERWSDILTLAEQSVVGMGSSISVYGWVDTSNGYFPLVALLEREQLNPFAENPDTVDISGPEYAAALERLRQLYRDGVIHNAYGSPMGSGGMPQEPIDPSTLVRDQRAALWGDLYFGDEQGNQVELPFERGSLAYPSSPMTEGYSGASEGYIISGGTAYPTESWRWIEWLSRQITDAPGTFQPGNLPFGRVPSREALAELLGYWEQIGEDNAALFREVIARGTPPMTRQPDWMLASALQEASGAVINDPNTTAKDALQRAQASYRANREQMMLTPTLEPDLRPVVVATPEPQVAPEGGTEVTFAAYGFSTSSLRPLVRRFREQYPEIFVKLVNPEFSGEVKLATLAGAADCFFWSDPIEDPADLAAVLDLQPLIDADATFPVDDYPPALISAFRRDGRTIALPASFSVRTLNYNRTKFAALGLDAPRADWGPDEFLEAAKAATSGDGEKKVFGYVPYAGIAQDLVFWTGQFGGRLTVGTGQDLRPNYTDPAVERAIRWYLDLSQVHEVMPPISLPYKTSDPYDDRSYEYVQSGRAGLWFDYGYSFTGSADNGFQVDEPFEVGIGPLPVGGVGLGASELQARGMFIGAQASDPEACWDWFTFLSTDTTLLYGALPARRSVAESDAFLAASPPTTRELYEIYRDALSQPVAQGESNYALYSAQMDTYWLFKAIVAARDGADLTRVLAEAQQLTTAFAECVVGGATPAVCAPQVDPEYQGFNLPSPDGPKPVG